MKNNCYWTSCKLVIIQSQTVILDIKSVVLDSSDYATKKESGHATGVDTYDLAYNKDFIALKAEVYKL